MPRFSSAKAFRSSPTLPELNIPFQDSGLFTRKSFLAQHPETVENVLRALVDAIAFIQEPENKTAVLKSLAQWLRLPKPDDASAGLRFHAQNVHATDLSQRRRYPQQHPGIDSHQRKIRPSQSRRFSRRPHRQKARKGRAVLIGRQCREFLSSVTSRVSMIIEGRELALVFLQGWHIVIRWLILQICCSVRTGLV